MASFKVIIILSLLCLTAACGSDYGHEIHGDQLTVYFTESSDQDAAEKIAHFWKDNALLTGKKQDIQLTRNNKTLEIRLIMNDEKASKEIPFWEKQILLELQDTLGQILNQNLELVVCNKRFETLINLNE